MPALVAPRRSAKSIPGRLVIVRETSSLASTYWNCLRVDIRYAAETYQQAELRSRLMGDRSETRGAARAALAGDAPAGTRGIRRTAQLLRLLALNQRAGMRLVDVEQLAGLERPTAHRVMKALAAAGLAVRDPATRRYRLGPAIFELATLAQPSYDFRDVCMPSLQRLARSSGDTLYLILRQGSDGVCVERIEGDYPIRAHTVDVGMRRPLGVGAGSLALLAALARDEADAIVEANARRYADWGIASRDLLDQRLERTRQDGFAANDLLEKVGALSLGVAILDAGDRPVGGMSIATISSRMSPARRDELVASLRAEARAIRAAMQAPQPTWRAP